MRRNKNVWLLVLLSNFFVKGSAFLVTVILARLLTPEYFGALSLALVGCGYLFPLATLSSVDAFMYFACEKGRRISQIHALLAESTVVGLIGVLLLSIILFAVRFLMQQPSSLWFDALYVLVFYLYPYFLVSLYLNYLRALGLSDKYAFGGGVASLALLVVVAIFGLFVPDGYVAYSWIVSYWLVFFAFFLFSATSRYRKTFLDVLRGRGKLSTRFSRYGLSISVGGVASLASYSADLMVVGALLDEATAGLYRVGGMLPLALMVVPGAYAISHYKTLVGNKGDSTAVRKYYVDFLKQMLPVSLFLLVGVLFFSEVLLSYVFGARFGSASAILDILIFLVPIYFLLRVPLLSVFNANGLVRLNLYISVSVLALVLVSCWILVPTYGVVGAAYGMVVSHALGAAAFLIVFSKRFCGLRFL